MHPGELPGRPQLLKSPNGSDGNQFVMVDNSDNVWVFWQTTSGNGGIWYRRFLRATMAWETAEGTQVPDIIGVEYAGYTAVSDTAGGIWFFWVRRPTPSSSNIWCTRHNPVTQRWSEPRQITDYPGIEAELSVLRGTDSSLWLFWRRGSTGSSKLFYRRIFLSI